LFKKNHEDLQVVMIEKIFLTTLVLKS